MSANTASLKREELQEGIIYKCNLTGRPVLVYKITKPQDSDICVKGCFYSDASGFYDYSLDVFDGMLSMLPINTSDTR